MSQVATKSNSFRFTLFLGLLLAWAATAVPAAAQEAEWIWLPNQPKEGVPENTVGVFRKTFQLRGMPEMAQMIITADDVYEVYINGRLVNKGDSRNLQQIDIGPRLRRGRNVVAVRVTNQRGNTAALAARLMVKEQNSDWVSYSTDNTWKSNSRTSPLWNVPFFNDTRWAAAQSFGRLGETAPWDRDADVGVEETDRNDRFQISDEFEVRMLVSDEETGSMIAMAFNEFGQIIVSKEGGPLLLLVDSNDDGQVDKSQVYCDKLKNCQGVLALNGEVFATGDGPDGAGLYRCKDTNRDGKLDKVTTVLKFKGGMSEHGAHGLTLGPDGYLYVIIGNHASPEKGYASTSPHRVTYEGDLVPRYEDPGGHAVNVKAPGGVVIRTDSAGRRVERFAGGLRNAYDLVFNREGELFIHDSDMESDEGTPWYRPTRLYHVVAGAEFGWRSGWAKWPEYFIDSLPQLLDTDRGSPTGATIYDHFAFPARYHNSLFLADWSEGRILAVRTKPSGAGYTADSEVFLQGSPLNVCDLEVGPDGSLYFITGGRGTFGALYRVTWRGEIPQAYLQMGDGISKAIRQPHLHSAWSRQRIAEVKEDLGAEWGSQLYGVAVSTANPDAYRIRAMDLMQLFGPAPTEAILMRLASDKSETVRAKAASLMALHTTDKLEAELVDMLEDGDRFVRRRVCEALTRLRHEVPGYKILPLLASDDRHEVWAARQLLETQSVDAWRDSVLKSDDHRLMTQGGLALINTDPSAKTAKAVIGRFKSAMGSFISDRDFVDMLRVTQVAIQKGELPNDSLSELRAELAQEFPAGNPIINRELMRLLAYLQADAPMNRYLDYLESDAPREEKIHVAAHLRFIEKGWGPGQKLEVIKKLEELRQGEGGGSYGHYLMNVSTDFAQTLSRDESFDVVAQADRWPSAALGALYRLPDKLSGDQIEQLKSVDRRLAASSDSATKRLRVGLVAVLAQAGTNDSMTYLREVWENEPERRPMVAMGLSQKPANPNWPYLMRSIHLLDDDAAVEVLSKLKDVRKAPAEAEYLRQTILCGLRLEDKAGVANELLQFWTGDNPAASSKDSATAMKAWQEWFARKYPNKLPAEIAAPSAKSRWELDELLEFLDSDEGNVGDITRGIAVFTKAECIKCHRFNGRGESLGPDLTSVSKRFSRREILQSILVPSHVISDQYASKVVELDDGRRVTGLLVPGAGDQMIVLQANGEKVTFDKSEILRTKVSTVSSMPEGLLDKLELQEIVDLFRYLGVGAPAMATRPKVPSK